MYSSVCNLGLWGGETFTSKRRLFEFGPSSVFSHLGDFVASLVCGLGLVLPLMGFEEAIYSSGTLLDGEMY